MSFVDTLKGKASSAWATIQTLTTPIAPSFTTPRVDLQGKRALVTGANSGIGLEVARSLASQGAETWLLCRSQKKADDARDDIKKTTGNNAIFVEIVDFASLKSIRDFAEKWSTRSTKEERAIDILVNNAGATYSTKNTSSEGFELSYVTNFLSQFLMMTLLLRAGDFTPNARIVQVASFGIYASDKLNPGDLGSKDMVGEVEEGGKLPASALFQLYGRSKALQVVFTKELQERLGRSSQYSNIVVQACHPGNVGTPIWTREGGGGDLGIVSKLAMMFSMSIPLGAQNPVFLATSPKVLGHRGDFWYRGNLKWVPAWMLDASLRKELWAKWEEDAQVDASGF